MTAGDANAGTNVVLACNKDTAYLAGSAPHPMGTWTVRPGAPSVPVFSDIHDPSAVVTNLFPGRYRLRWVIEGGPTCDTRQDDMRIILADTIPSVADAGPDTSICHHFPYRMLGNPPEQNEIGYWTVTPAGPTFIPDSSASNAILSNLGPDEVFTFVWHHRNNCGLTADTMVVTTTNTMAPMQSNAGVDQCQPSGTTSVVLEGNDPSPYLGYWAQVSGPAVATFSDSSAYLVMVSNLIDGHYSFEWVNYFVDCGATRDTVLISIANDVTPAAAGADADICNTTYQLGGNPPVTGEAGYWTQTVGPGNVIIVDSTAYNTKLTNLTEGTYRFLWHMTNGTCGTSVDSMVLRVSVPQTPANAGANDTVCGSPPLSYTLNASGLTSGTGLWSVVSAPNTPVFSSYSDTSAQISGLISGRYIFQWSTYSGPFCPVSRDTVVIWVGQAANAGSDQSICEVTQANLIGNTGSNGRWTQAGTSPGVATIDSISPNSAIASNLVTGTYNFIYTIGGGLCPGSVDTVKVTISGQPTPADAGPAQFVCDSTKIHLAGNTPIIGTGRWIQMLGPAGGSFSPDNTTPHAVFNGAVPGNLYVFRWIITDGGCSSADEVRVENYAPPSPCDAGPNRDVCGTSTAMLAATPVYGTGTWTQLSGPTATIVSPNLPTTMITGDRKSTRLNSSHSDRSRMPSSA
jgi:hypothetical protein